MAPVGVADRLEVWRRATLVASAVSIDGQPATADVTKPGCFGSYSQTLSLRVSAVVGTSPADFTLTRSGGW